MLEHYPNALREEHRERMLTLGKVPDEKEWAWLDEAEAERWGEPGADGQPKPKPKTQRELLDELRKRGQEELKQREERGEFVQPDGSPGSFTSIR